MLAFFRARFTSFTYLNVTQFLGALNDNVFKLLVVFSIIHIEGVDQSHKILATAGFLFVLPFLLFSASSGTLADRISKSKIIIVAKAFELVVMILGLIAFIYESKVGSYLTLFLLASQSALFGPSKYGILPEIVERERISKANGLMTLLTFLAIIFGTFFASFLTDITARNFVFASIFCIGIALTGFFTSLCIEYTPPSGSHKKLNPQFYRDIFHSLKIATEKPSLLMSVVGSAFFLFLGAYVQLNMIPFAVQSLGLTDVQGGYLFLLTALGIGGGAIVAGKVSGRIVELGLVPLAGIGVTLSCFYLDYYSDHLFAIIPLVAAVGFFGGIYLIPLDAYIQVSSPDQYRGQIIAATNFLSFFGVMLASGMIYVVTEIFGFNADKGFTIIGIITLGITIIIGYQFFDYVTRFLGMIASRLHFKLTFQGRDKNPETPVVYVCAFSAWSDTLIMLGSQRRRMRFFIEYVDETKWIKRLYRMLRVVQIPLIEPLENNVNCIEVIRKSLNNGISVCIFYENDEIDQEIVKLNDSFSFRESINQEKFPMIPVFIHKGEKNGGQTMIRRILNKFRIPAKVTFGSTETPSTTNNLNDSRVGIVSTN